MNINHQLHFRTMDYGRDMFGNMPASTWFERVAKGLLPPPVSIGGRSVAYLDHELQAIAAARIAGKSDDQIRQIVKNLVAARDALADTSAP